MLRQYFVAVLSTYDEVAAASRLMQEKIAFWEKLQRHTLSKRRVRLCSAIASGKAVGGVKAGDAQSMVEFVNV